jgi:hypothetical protein
MDNLKVLSMWQPYLGLMPARKRNETRHWKTDDRGWVALHATKRSETLAAQRQIAAVLSKCTKMTPDEWMDQFRGYPTGCIVAIARIADQIPMVSRKVERTINDFSLRQKVRFRRSATHQGHGGLMTIQRIDHQTGLIHLVAIDKPEFEIGTFQPEALVPDGIYIEEQEEIELATGLWQEGRYAHQFEGFRFLPEPVPYLGRQGKYVPLDDATVKEAIQRQLNGAVTTLPKPAEQLSLLP